MLPAGAYRLVTDEELIEGISFPVYRRVATMIFVPAPTHGASSIEMVTIGPLDLQAALERDLVRATQDELEAQLIAAPASTWEEDAAATSWVSSKTPWCSRQYI